MLLKKDGRVFRGGLTVIWNKVTGTERHSSNCPHSLVMPSLGCVYFQGIGNSNIFVPMSSNDF